MLVLSRKLNQEIMIGENVKVTVLKVRGNTVRLGIEAPRHVRVLRGELPIEKDEATAEVTIVFNDPIETETPEGLDSLEFKPPEPSAESIRYQTRMPKAVSHNRLKAIVAEMGKTRS